MNDQLDKRDQLTKALLNDGADLADITEKLAIAKSQLHHIKNCTHTWDYLEHCDSTLYELSDALVAIKNVEWFLKTGQSPESSPKPSVNLRRITWKIKLENFFATAAYTTLTTSAILGCCWLGSWGLFQARPDIPQLETATNYSKGLAFASFSAFLMSAIGGGVTAGLIDMENKENV